jgi:hypothetical protein
MVVLVLLGLIAQGALAARARPLVRQDNAGAAVPYVGPAGEELALFTVEQIVEPFGDYDPGAPPARGNHYALVLLSIENRAPRPLAIDPATILLQDTDGFLVSPEPAALPPGGAAGTAALASSELAPGEMTTGALVFPVVNAAQPARVVFQPARDRLIILADFTASPIASARETRQTIGAPSGGGSADAPPLARTQATYDILLVTYSCPPGTPLPDIQVTPCRRAPIGFEALLSGAAGVWSSVDLTAEQAGPVWHDVPAGQYALTFTALPDGHDLFYVYGEGTEPTVDYVGGPGAVVTLGAETVTPGGFLPLTVYFADSDG